MSKNINMKKADQIKFQELINKKQMWIKRAVDEINSNGTDEAYKRAVSYINFEAGINIDLENLLSNYCNVENIEKVKVAKKASGEAGESVHEDIKAEEQDIL